MNTYEAKQAAKKERYEELAQNAAYKSDQLFESSRKETDCIPFGQPILVGHHSEGRHRKAIERSHNKMQACVDAGKKAEYYESKAKGVGKGGISSDDPDAVKKLKEKLSTLEEAQTRMKEINRVWRLIDKKPDAAATIKAVDALNDKDSAIVKGFTRQYPSDKGPIPSFSITNNNANMRTVKKRLEALKAKEEHQEAEDIKGDGFTIVENKEENRIQILFDQKPSKETITLLKSHGFRWAPSNEAWQRQLNNAGIYAAQCVFKKLSEGE